MRIRNIIAIIMMACILGACGSATPATAETATPATAETAAPATAETAAPATAETAAPATQEFPSQTTLVVWLEKGKTLSIEEYTDHFLVASADGTEEFPLSLPHLEEEELLFTELPVEWQEALSTSN